MKRRKRKNFRQKKRMQNLDEPRVVYFEKHLVSWPAATFSERNEKRWTLQHEA